MPTNEPKRRARKEDKEIGVPETGADIDSAVEPSDEYDLDLPIETDALDGALEEKTKKVGVPETGADIDSGVEPEDDYELDLGIDVDAMDGALEDTAQQVGVPETGADIDSAVEPEDSYELDLPGFDALDGTIEVEDEENEEDE